VRWLALGLLLSAAAAVCAGLLVAGPGVIDGLGLASGPGESVVAPAAPAAPSDLLAPAPPLTLVHQDPSGSVVEHTRFASASLGSEGSFYVYLPPGYSTAASAPRYPVLYLLHGRQGHAVSFVEMGIQESLDGLIAHHLIEPMIVVMVQDAIAMRNWRDTDVRHSATYVVEVQELVDRMFSTVPSRGGRAIAGSSMGGFGAMNVALANPLRFAVVESWLGFFDGLQEALHADRRVISRLGLHAFLYGAAADPVAVPSEDPEFAAELSELGAQAQGVIYPGGHSLEKIREHLDTGLVFAGRSLREARHREDVEEDDRRAPRHPRHPRAASTR
jgi:enterochelin esterase-like enzyme